MESVLCELQVIVYYERVCGEVDSRANHSVVNIFRCVCSLITQLSTFFVVCTSSLLSNANRTHFVRVGELARD
jgi:hypothetical protein